MLDLLVMLQASAHELGDAKPWDEQGAELFRRHHSQLMYQVPHALLPSQGLRLLVVLAIIMPVINAGGYARQQCHRVASDPRNLS